MWPILNTCQETLLVSTQAEDWVSVEAGAGHRALGDMGRGAIFRHGPHHSEGACALVGCEKPLLPLLQTEEGALLKVRG